MLAVDTNVVVRYLTRDSPREAARARAVIENTEIWVSTTVLLETEWVLRGGYGLSRTAVVEALRAFAALPGISLEDAALASTALDWAAGGMDLADAFHLAAAGECEAFITFDRRLPSVAGRLGSLPVREP